MPQHPDPRKLERIMRDAGALALQGFRLGETVDSWDKSPGHCVTQTDLAVDQYLRGALQQLDPQAGWLSEESDTDTGLHDDGPHDKPDEDGQHLDGPMWIVDPIDGTRDFIHGRKGWAVSVAYCIGGLPQLAMLYAPVTDQLWSAARGQGALRDQQRLSVSKRQSLKGARVPAEQLADVDAILATVEKPNSIALRMAMVADDRADLVATLRWGHAWDLAAAALIVEEAGGIVTEASGKPLRFTSERAVHFGVLCSCAGIHKQALAHLRTRADRIRGQTKP